MSNFSCFLFNQEIRSDLNLVFYPPGRVSFDRILHWSPHIHTHTYICCVSTWTYCQKYTFLPPETRKFDPPVGSVTGVYFSRPPTLVPGPNDRCQKYKDAQSCSWLVEFNIPYRHVRFISSRQIMSGRQVYSTYIFRRWLVRVDPSDRVEVISICRKSQI